MDQHRVSVLIRIPPSNPSPALAIASVLRNKQHIRDLHIEQRAHSQEATLNYPKAKEHLAELEAAGITLTWHSEFNASKLQTQALVHMEPDLRVVEAAFLQLKRDMLERPDCHHYAVSSMLQLKTDVYSYWELPWYGVLFPLLMVDWLAWLWTWGQHARTVDLRCQLVQTTWGGRARLSRQGWWRWWIGTGVCRTAAGDVTCVQMPVLPKDRGRALVLRTIKDHAHMTWRKPWWLALYALYYFLFAFPWWTFLLAASEDGTTVGLTGLASSLAMRSFTNPAWVAVQLVHWTLVTYLLWAEIMLPANTEGVALLLYPVYLTLSPLFFLYGRFHSSRAVLSEVASKYQREQLGQEPEQ